MSPFPSYGSSESARTARELREEIDAALAATHVAALPGDETSAPQDAQRAVMERIATIMMEAPRSEAESDQRLACGLRRALSKLTLETNDSSDLAGSRLPPTPSPT